MRCNKSFINIGLFQNNLKRFVWLSVLYTAVLFIAIPFQILSSYSNNPFWAKQQLYFKTTSLQTLLLLVIPAILGNLLFKYLQEDNYAFMVHSLPIKRSVLYRSNVATGILLVVSPFIIIGLTTLLIRTLPSIQGYFSVSDIMQWTMMSIIVGLVFFFSSVFVSIITENHIIQVLLTYILILLPTWLVALVKGNINMLLYGYIKSPANSISPDNAILLPFLRIVKGINYSDAAMKNIELLSYVFMCLCFYCLGKIFYSKRKLEGSENTISFKPFLYLFTLIITLSCMLLVGLVYFDLPWKSVYKLPFGYFIGLLAGFFTSYIISKGRLVSHL